MRLGSGEAHPLHSLGVSHPNQHTMEERIWTFGLLIIPLFIGAWFVVHSLVNGLSEGVLHYRDSSYYRRDPRRFHHSDFWVMFLFQSTYALFIVLLFTMDLFLLASDDPGRYMLLAASVVNLAFALRRPTNPKTKPSQGFSVLSLYSIVMTSLFLLFSNGSKPIGRWLLLLCGLAFLASTIVHIVRLHSGAYILNARKKTKPSKPPIRNA